MSTVCKKSINILFKQEKKNKKMRFTLKRTPIENNVYFIKKLYFSANKMKWFVAESKAIVKMSIFYERMNMDVVLSL